MITTNIVLIDWYGLHRNTQSCGYFFFESVLSSSILLKRNHFSDFQIQISYYLEYLKKHSMNKEKSSCKIDIKSDAKVTSRDRELVLTLNEELDKPFADVSYTFLFILTVAILLFTYMVQDRNK